VHYTTKRGALPSSAPNDWTITTAVAANYADHIENASSPEIQAFYQYSYNETNGQIGHVLGVQGVLVQALWTAWCRFRNSFRPLPAWL